MSAMKNLSMDIQQLIDLKAKLSAADALADIVRGKALKDTSSDEPYETAVALSGRIANALSIVEMMLDEAQPAAPDNPYIHSSRWQRI